MLQILWILVSLAAAVFAAPTQDIESTNGRAIPLPTYHDGSSVDERSREQRSTTSWTCAQQATLVTGGDEAGAGVRLTNGDNEARSFYFYWNSCDTVPYQYISLPPGASRFVSLPASFQGRVTRGTDESNLNGQPQLLGTWVELTFEETGLSWGDVSLIRGCDGAATIEALDGSGAHMGFEEWVLDGAPEGAYDKKESGVEVIRATGDVQTAQEATASDYLGQKIGYDRAYIDNVHGNPVISSSNSQFAVVFFKGRP